VKAHGPVDVMHRIAEMRTERGATLYTVVFGVMSAAAVIGGIGLTVGIGVNTNSRINDVLVDIKDFKTDQDKQNALITAQLTNIQASLTTFTSVKFRRSNAPKPD
jgi:hypothetical protein